MLTTLNYEPNILESGVESTSTVLPTGEEEKLWRWPETWRIKDAMHGDVYIYLCREETPIRPIPNEVGGPTLRALLNGHKRRDNILVQFLALDGARSEWTTISVSILE